MKLKFCSWSLTPYLLIIALFGLQACGGGDSAPPPADANPAGYYTGSAAVKTDGEDTVDFNISDLQIMIQGNRIMMMSDAEAILYDGTFTISGNDLTSTVTIYHNGNKTAATSELTATITEGSQLTGTLTGTELGNGTFVSTYSNLSDTVSDLSQVNNRFWYASLNEAVSYAFEFELENTSTILFSNQSNDQTFAGCVILTGSTFEPIANSSLFEVIFVFDGCDNSLVDGAYIGYSQAKTETAISITVSNGKYAFADNFELSPW